MFEHLHPKQEHKHSPSPCPGCPMPDARRVGNRGTIDAPLVIIGESPGTEELKYGAPFSGPSGELLVRSLPAGFNLDEDAYVINAMQCRPPKTNSQPKDKDYKTRACAACRGRVLDQVFQSPRKVVLALGGWSNISLTANYGYKITQKRGEIYELTYTDANGVVSSTTVVPAVHPAFLLRGSGNPKVFEADLLAAVSLAYPTRGYWKVDAEQYSPEEDDEENEEQVPRNPRPQIVGEKFPWSDPKYKVLTTAGEIRELTAHLKDLVALSPIGQIHPAADTETSGFSHIKDEILCFGIYHPDLDDTAYIIEGTRLKEIAVGLYITQESIDPDYAEAVRELLVVSGCRYIWQFGKFDEKFLRSNKLVDEDWGIQEDTGLASYATSEATRDHDLDEQAKNLLGAPDHKHMVKPYVAKKTDSYSNVPPEVLYDYLAKDLKKTYYVWQYRRKEISDDADLEKLYVHTLVPSSHMLAGVEQRGIYVDWDYVRINQDGATEDDVKRGLVPSLRDKDGKRTERGIEAEIAELNEELARVIGYPVNPNSPDEVAELLYDTLGLTIKGRRPNDTRKETLEKLPPHEVVKLLREYRSLTKMKGTYITAILQRATNNRIHTSFKLHSTTTGRLSSTEPNIQNIPREARWRRMYRAAPGMILVEGDYNSAELRMLAALSGDEFLTGIFLDDKRSLHDEVSIALFGENFTEYQRIRAKAINFGIPYGRKAVSIAIEHDVPVIEAQGWIDGWFERAPKARDFLKWCRSGPTKGLTLVTVFGRKRRSGVVSLERLDALQNEFSNFPMQSPISDFTLHSGMQLAPKLKKEGAYIVNLIHDAVLVECPDDSRERIEQVGGILKETMEHIPTEWIITPIKFRVDLKIGYNWGMGKKPKDFWATWQPRQLHAA